MSKSVVDRRFKGKKVGPLRNSGLKWIISTAFCVLSICSGSICADSRVSPFQFQQQPGPYPVGLKVIDQYDRSRGFPASELPQSSAGDRTRPLQTLIWYPSLRSPAKPMTVGDYVRLADTEIHFNAPDQAKNRWRSLLETSFDIQRWAVQNAQRTRNRYPVQIGRASCRERV